MEYEHSEHEWQREQNEAFDYLGFKAKNDRKSHKSSSGQPQCWPRHEKRQCDNPDQNCKFGQWISPVKNALPRAENKGIMRTHALRLYLKYG